MAKFRFWIDTNFIYSMLCRFRGIAVCRHNRQTSIQAAGGYWSIRSECQSNTAGNSSHISTTKYNGQVGLQMFIVIMAYLHCRTRTLIPIWLGISVPKMGTAIIGNPNLGGDSNLSPCNVNMFYIVQCSHQGLEFESELVPESVTSCPAM